MKLKIETAPLFLSPFLLASVSASASQEDMSIYTLGMDYYHSAKYSGSDETTETIIPLFRIQYDNYFIDTSSGIGISKEFDNGFYFTQALGYATGRTENDSSWKAGSVKLRGMGKIRAVINSSTTLGWHFNRAFAIEGSVYTPLTDSQGMKYEIGVKYNILAQDSDTLILSTNAQFGDSRSNNLIYGVSGEQNRRSGYNQYHASSGLYGMDVGLNWTHLFGEHWWTYADVTYTHLTNNVSRSPIVFRKGETELSFGLLYSF